MIGNAFQPRSPRLEMSVPPKTIGDQIASEKGARHERIPPSGRFVGNLEVTPSLGGASMHNEVPEKRGGLNGSLQHWLGVY
jgi:hypothetical protein